MTLGWPYEQCSNVDNFRDSQWRKFRQYDDISGSVNHTRTQQKQIMCMELLVFRWIVKEQLAHLRFLIFLGADAMAVGCFVYCLTDPARESHNAPVPYATMHHFVTAMCTHVHIYVTKWCIEGYLSDD